MVYAIAGFDYYAPIIGFTSDLSAKGNTREINTSGRRDRTAKRNGRDDNETSFARCIDCASQIWFGSGGRAARRTNDEITRVV